MTRIYQRLCYFCWGDGEFVQAIADYRAKDLERYDVCKRHGKGCESLGFDVNYWDDPEEGGIVEK